MDEESQPHAREARTVIHVLVEKIAATVPPLHPALVAPKACSSSCPRAALPQPNSSSRKKIMFAGLGLEGSDDDDDDDDEETPTTKPTPPTKPPAKMVARGPALPEADDDDDDDDDVGGDREHHSVYGDIDPDDLAITIETLQAISKDLTLFRSRVFKPLREAIGPLATELTGDASGRGGRTAKRHGSRLGNLDPNERHKQMDRDAMNHRVLRAERLARLEDMQKGDDDSTLRLTDGSGGGPAALQFTGGDDPNASLNAAQGESLVPFTIPDGPAAASLGELDEATLAAPAAKLHLARSCYICKAPYRELHAFYAQLCMECAKLNWRKRTESCNLYGRVALVTGGRVKIGLRIALKLLRCGCEVISTTRFPVDATRRFAAEEDCEQWRHRLHVVGADFRDLKGLERLCDALPKLVRRLDIIVNNACQTVRRPPQYYLPLLEAEATVTPEEEPRVKQWTAAHASLRALLDEPLPAQTPTPTPIAATAAVPISDDEPRTEELAAADAAGESVLVARAAGAAPGAGSDAILPGMSLPVSAGVGQSAMLSQLALVPGDETCDDAAFPKGMRDGNTDLNQQLDLRRKNSWMLRLEEVSTPEMAEVLAINALAPAVINGRLKSFMEASGVPDATPPTPDGMADEPPPEQHDLKFVINVSAMEGRFYKYKQPTHPHTNMAKAALNMMTRTSAADYAKSRIYMTAVDTGWINDEKPAAQAAADAATHNFQTPIDEIDAAARVLDPIIAPLRRLAAGEDAKPPSGVFLKDYDVCEW